MYVEVESRYRAHSNQWYKWKATLRAQGFAAIIGAHRSGAGFVDSGLQVGGCARHRRRSGNTALARRRLVAESVARCARFTRNGRVLAEFDQRTAAGAAHSYRSVSERAILCALSEAAKPPRTAANSRGWPTRSEHVVTMSTPPRWTHAALRHGFHRELRQLVPTLLKGRPHSVGMPRSIAAA